MAELFENARFAVDVHLDATRLEMLTALEKFSDAAQRSETRLAVFYYAGHGAQLEWRNYLVPVDTVVSTADQLRDGCVDLNAFLGRFQQKPGRTLIIILDACRDNPFAPAMKRTMAVQLVDKGFSDIEPSSGFMVVYAAKHGEVALDGEGVDSPFASALARDVKEPRVEVRKLFDIVRDDVWNTSRHQQQPFIYGSPPGREDFYFVAGK